jgi:hypothetical protein
MGKANTYLLSLLLVALHPSAGCRRVKVARKRPPGTEFEFLWDRLMRSGRSGQEEVYGRGREGGICHRADGRGTVGERGWRFVAGAASGGGQRGLLAVA